MSDRCLFLKSGIRSEELGIKFRLWRVTEDLKLKNNNEISQSRCKGQVIYLLYPESVKLNMEKHNYAALMQCFLSNLNPDILTQQVNLFLESCFHSLLPFGSSQHYSEPLQGDALFPRASPLQKQSTGLFLNSPLAEGLLLKVFRALRSATRGSAPWTPQPLKRLAKLFDSGLSRIQVFS